MIYQIVLMIHILVAIFLVVLVLLQQGKGATAGAAFGGGASQTVFGSRGSGSFLLKLTIFFAVVFFSTSILLGNFASKHAKQGHKLQLPTSPVTPATQAVLPGKTSIDNKEKKKK